MYYAVEIDNGIITRVQSSEDARLRLDGVDVALAHGAVIMPGLVDAHCHLMGLGQMAERVQLRSARSASECVERVRKRIGSVGSNEWILGFGWNQEEWDTPDLPTRTMLDAAFPDTPVMLSRIDAHAVWVNTAALSAAGMMNIGQNDDAEIVRDDDNLPTGILLEGSAKLLERHCPEPTHTQRMRWIRSSIEKCVCLGLTEVHDMNVEAERLESMTEVADAGDMVLRCNMFMSAQHDEWIPATPRPSILARNLSVAGVKYFADGALGSRGALLLEPYNDMPGTTGIALLICEQLVASASRAIEVGHVIATHAIGDGANRLVLDAYQQLRSRFPDAVLRIEHAQILHPTDIQRFRALNVIPSMQSIHCISDAMMAEARLGSERCTGAYAWKSLLNTGVPILGGSDFPIESADPLSGLRAFHYRQMDTPSIAWHPEEAITTEAALAAYTHWPQRGLPYAEKRGTLDVGNDADVVVLSGDPFDADTVVILTIVGGEIVYQK